MANKRQKPRGALVDRRPDRVGAGEVQLVPSQRRDVPSVPRGLEPEARDAWHTFWSSNLASLVDDADVVALRHWAWCLSERVRLNKLIRTTPLVRGSTGQVRLNPLATYVAELNSQIKEAEEKFGMSPLYRMRLGIALGDATNALADLRASLGDAQPVMIDVDAIEVP